jgi:hypothetical protein
MRISTERHQGCWIAQQKECRTCLPEINKNGVFGKILRWTEAGERLLLAASRLILDPFSSNIMTCSIKISKMSMQGQPRFHESAFDVGAQFVGANKIGA